MSKQKYTIKLWKFIVFLNKSIRMTNFFNFTFFTALYGTVKSQE